MSEPVVLPIPSAGVGYIDISLLSTDAEYKMALDAGALQYSTWRKKMLIQKAAMDAKHIASMTNVLSKTPKRPAVDEPTHEEKEVLTDG